MGDFDENQRGQLHGTEREPLMIDHEEESVGLQSSELAQNDNQARNLTTSQARAVQTCIVGESALT